MQLQVKPPLVTQVCHVGMPLFLLATLLAVQVPVSAPWKGNRDGSSAWASATRVRHEEGASVPGFSLTQDHLDR